MNFNDQYILYCMCLGQYNCSGHIECFHPMGTYKNCVMACASQTMMTAFRLLQQFKITNTLFDV